MARGGAERLPPVDWEGESISVSEAIRRMRLLHPRYDNRTLGDAIAKRFGIVPPSTSLVAKAQEGVRGTKWRAPQPHANGKPMKKAATSISAGITHLKGAVACLGVQGCRAVLDLLEDNAP